MQKIPKLSGFDLDCIFVYATFGLISAAAGPFPITIVLPIVL